MILCMTPQQFKGFYKFAVRTNFVCDPISFLSSTWTCETTTMSKNRMRSGTIREIFFYSNKLTFDNSGVARKTLASKLTFWTYSGILGVSFPHWNHVYEVCKPSHVNRKETHTFYQKSLQSRNSQKRTKTTLCPWKQDITFGASNWHGMWDWQNIRDWNN